MPSSQQAGRGCSLHLLWGLKIIPLEDSAINQLHDIMMVSGPLTAVPVADRGAGGGQKDLQPHF